MTVREPAADPTLLCAFFGGPKDGVRSADLPRELSGIPLTGHVMRCPLEDPRQSRAHAVYECVGDRQVDGFWRFEFRGIEPPGRKDPAPDPAKAARVEPAPRRANAERWWIASEFVLRHPEFVIRDVSVIDPRFDSLFVRADGGGPTLRLDRDGSIRSPGRLRLPPGEVLQADDPHRVVKAIEGVMKNPLSGARPATTRRGLAYRAIAGVLRLQQDVRARWSAHEVAADDAILAGFPLSAEARAIAADDDGPAQHWVIQRDDDPVAVVTTDGLLLTGADGFAATLKTPEVDLMHVYRTETRALIPILAASLGHVLR